MTSSACSDHSRQKLLMNIYFVISCVGPVIRKVNFQQLVGKQ